MYKEKEHALLEMLSENEVINQRRLSKLLDMSLGSVNMLIKKMQREGFIKYKSLSSRQIAYTLTPKGIAQKARKAYKYITYQYRYINDTKEKIKAYLESRIGSEEVVYLILDDSELSEIVLIATEEIKYGENLKIIWKGEHPEDSEEERLVILVNEEDKYRFIKHRTEIILEMV